MLLHLLSFEYQRIVERIFRFLDEQLEKGCGDCVAGIDTDYVMDGKVFKTSKVIFEVVSD